MKTVTFTEGALGNNVYVLTEKGECVIIDPTYDDGEVLRYVKNNGLKIAAVLLTHGHFDHCGGVKRITDEADTPVYVGAEDMDLCMNAAENPWGVHCENCAPDKFFREGDLTIGNFSFKIVFTPGHTRGSVVVICEDAMFSGDTLFAGGIGRTDLDGGDAYMMRASLKKLRGLSRDYTVFPGHGEKTSLAYEKTNNPWLAAL